MLHFYNQNTLKYFDNTDQPYPNLNPIYLTFQRQHTSFFTLNTVHLTLLNSNTYHTDLPFPVHTLYKIIDLEHWQTILAYFTNII